VCYLNTGEFEKAAFYFEKYFEIAPTMLMFPGRPISLYIKMRKYEKVEDLIARTEKIRPNYWGVFYGKALLLAAKGEKEKALAFWKNSEVYSLLGMKDEAIQHLNQEIRQSVRYPYLFYLYLLNNSFYENLRDDPRFKEIVNNEKKLYEEYLEKYGDL
jgi:tetratricopeptide (TPR) repeat protein